MAQPHRPGVPVRQRHTDDDADGMQLSEDDFAPYVEAMRRDDMIVASHAHTHPATACFQALYFEPLTIHSLLHVGISVGGVLIGLAPKRAAARQAAPAWAPGTPAPHKGEEGIREKRTGRPPGEGRTLPS
ncbi:MAG: hypothetical protein U5L74_02560 [Ideonella sp.]|nr:hypothetical protein [Ideonella sp.]